MYPEGTYTSDYSLQIQKTLVCPKLSEDDSSITAFYWGAHIANDINFDDKSLLPSHLPLNNNAKFEGLKLVAMREIKVHQEIFVDYNFAGNT